MVWVRYQLGCRRKQGACSGGKLRKACRATTCKSAGGVWGSPCPQRSCSGSSAHARGGSRGARSWSPERALEDRTTQEPWPWSEGLRQGRGRELGSPGLFPHLPPTSHWRHPDRCHLPGCRAGARAGPAGLLPRARAASCIRGTVMAGGGSPLRSTARSASTPVPPTGLICLSPTSIRGDSSFH